MEDSMIWMQNTKNGLVTAKKYYDLIVSYYLPLAHHSLHSQLWHLKIPQNIKCFIWMVIENKINTWDNLT